MTNATERPSTKPRGLERFFVLLALFAVLHAALVLLGYACRVDDAKIATFWPSTGFALAVLLLTERRRWPAILVIMFLVETIVAGSEWRSPAGVVARGASIVEAVLGAALIRRCLGKQVFCWGLTTALTIVVAGVLAAAVGGLIVAVYVLVQLPDYESRVVFFNWFFAHGIGMILIVPLVLTWSDAIRSGPILPPLRKMIEPAICLLTTLFAAMFVFGADWLQPLSVLHHPYLIGPCFIWAALRFQPRIVTSLLVLVAVMLVLNAQDRRGSTFVSPDQPMAVLVLSIQAYLAVACGATLVLSAVVTDRQRAYEELAHLQLKLAHVARLSTAGEVVAAIAHEVNQPIYAVVNYAKASRNLMSQGATCDMDLLHDWNEQITEAAGRAGEIIKRWRSFVTRGEFRPQPTDANDLVRSACRLMAFTLQKSRVRVKQVLATDLPPVAVDAVHIQQVLVNLLQNACEAMASVGVDQRRLTVRTKRMSEWVSITVADTGPGLPDDGRSNLFDSFFTTKPKGLGMGLAISKTIIEAHGGRLWADTAKGRGAEFLFTLPTERPDDRDAG
jgi:signal transduction histidine kinase